MIKYIVANLLIVLIIGFIAQAMKRKHKSKPKTGRLLIGVVLTVKGKIVMNITGQLTTAQQSIVSAKFEDADGIQVPVQGVPAWVSDNPAVATVAAAADGMSAVVQGISPGTANINVSAEGDPTPGKDTVTGTVAVTVVADESTQVALTFGAPTPKQ